MAKVWFVGKAKRLPAYEMPFGDAVRVLELTKADHVWSDGKGVWPGRDNSSPDFGLEQKTCVETTGDELVGWPVGVYWARKVAAAEASQRLATVATALEPFDPKNWG